MREFIFGFVFILSIAMSLGSLSAQNAEQKSDSADPLLFFEGKEYRFVGPSRGGRATAITGVPKEPFSFYMGATGGGVWETRDAGTTWQNLSDGQILAGSIGALAVAPSDRSTIYVGTGESCPRGNVSPGVGLYKSIDRGKTWIHGGLANAGQIAKIVVHPDDSEKVYVAALGQIFGKNSERGVYRTNNGGKDWEQILFQNDSTGAVDLVMHPDNPRILYAALWQVERKPWTLIDGGPDGGIWKSLDGGDHWEKLTGGLPKGLIGRIGLAIAPSNPSRVFAVIRAPDPQSGIYRTDDDGVSWKHICKENKLTQRAWYYNHITVDPKDENTVYVNNVGFHKSINGGKSFDQQIKTPHGDHHGLWINPDNPKIMINCNDGGACVSLNGGQSWSSQRNQPTAQFYRLTVDNQFPYRLYAGQQDNSSISVHSHAPSTLTPFQDWLEVGGGESADVAVNFEDPDIVWATTYSGEITILNLRTGEKRETTAYPHYTEGTEQRDLKYRWQWNFPVTTSQHNTEVVYHTSNYVHKTENSGQDWHIISPDLTRNIDAYQGIPGGPIQHDATGVEVYSSIFAFEESPFDSSELWVGSDDGLLHVSRNGGNSWDDITPPNMPWEATINKIELSSSVPGRAFVVAMNYRYNDFKPYIFRTTDFGKTWNSLADGKNGIPEDHFVRAIAEDPKKTGILYAGTEFGMYISFDDGVNWHSLQLNLPHVPITDLEITEDDLVLSTQGRAFWILDDIACFREMEYLKSKVSHFYKVKNAIRTNIIGFNPRFEFYLADSVHQDSLFEIEIRNEKDELVRLLSTKAKNKLNKITVKKGYNSISWNMKHEGPTLVPDLVTMVIQNPSAGPTAVPGSYRTKLEYGDWTATRSFKIESDPRWNHIPAESYQHQLDMGQSISSMITEVHEMITNLRSTRKQLKQLHKMAKKSGYSANLSLKADTLVSKIDELEAKMIQNKSKASQDNINYPRVFSNHIGRLYSVVVAGHHQPTKGSLERFEDLEKVFVTLQNDYANLINNEIGTFNSEVSKEQVPSLIIPKRNIRP